MDGSHGMGYVDRIAYWLSGEAYWRDIVRSRHAGRLPRSVLRHGAAQGRGRPRRARRRPGLDVALCAAAARAASGRRGDAGRGLDAAAVRAAAWRGARLFGPAGQGRGAQSLRHLQGPRRGHGDHLPPRARREDGDPQQLRQCGGLDGDLRRACRHPLRQPRPGRRAAREPGAERAGRRGHADPRRAVAGLGRDGGRGRREARLVQHRHLARALPPRGQEDDGLRDRRAARLDPAGRGDLSRPAAGSAPSPSTRRSANYRSSAGSRPAGCRS